MGLPGSRPTTRGCPAPSPSCPATSRGRLSGASVGSWRLKDFTLSIADDVDDEPNETFTVTLAAFRPRAFRTSDD